MAWPVDGEAAVMRIEHSGSPYYGTSSQLVTLMNSLGRHVVAAPPRVWDAQARRAASQLVEALTHRLVDEDENRYAG